MYNFLFLDDGYYDDVRPFIDVGPTLRPVRQNGILLFDLEEDSETEYADEAERWLALKPPSLSIAKVCDHDSQE